MTRRRSARLVIAVLFALTILVWKLAPHGEERHVVLRGEIAALKGSAYSFRLGGVAGVILDTRGDSSGSPQRSTLNLLENGQHLGPPHAIHANVAATGAGMYSHWGNTVIFSASDSSDPRTNGRTYVARYRVGPAKWLVALAVLVLVAVPVTVAWPPLRPRLPVLLRRAASFTPPALFVLAALATATHWLPLLQGRVVAKPAGPITLPEARERLGTFYPFERLVAPFVIVPSRLPGTLRMTRDGRELREVVDIPAWTAATDAVFYDGDRVGGDGVVAYFPSETAGKTRNMTLGYRAVVTRGGVALLWSAFFLAVCMAVAARRIALRVPMARAAATGAVGSAIAGAALVALNVSGYFIPVRSERPDLFALTASRVMVDDPWLSLAALEPRLVPSPNEPRADFAIRATDVVSTNIRHVWNYANVGTLGLHVAPWTNFLLWGLGETSPQLYRYHYAAWRPALARGAGMCAQATLVLVGVLRERGYDARIVQLDGHTVVTAEVADGIWYILDPDVGVSFRRGLAEIEGNPEIVRAQYQQTYRALGHDDPDYAAGKMVEFYAKPGNYTEPKGGNEMLGELWTVRERLAGWLKWLIPAGLGVLAIALRTVAARFERRGR